MPVILWLTIGIIFFIGYVRYLEHKSIFLPVRELAFTPADINLTFEDCWMTTEDNLKLHGWFVPNAKAKSTLMFFHGNAGNIGDRLEKVRLFQALGLNVFIFDYRGYGKSQGSPGEAGLYKDSAAAYKYLVQERHIRPSDIILYGASLGAVFAVDLAVKKEVGAFIIDSAFTCATDMAKVIYPFIPSFCVRIKLDSVSKVNNIRVPKLFIHSTEDEIVPFALGRKLFAAAAEPKIFCSIKGSHNDGFDQDREIFWKAIKDFLKDLKFI